ncbi:cell wall-binding repeat-containing protein [Pseudalkalibacillus hwajinpoensis]|uniref:cell wall-binding repeat-containing protein n=1 Tax=Guptibacillus hwajinpoensis TaxID=208199 RepID=UPI00325B9B59
MKKWGVALLVLLLMVLNGFSEVHPVKAEENNSVENYQDFRAKVEAKKNSSSVNEIPKLFDGEMKKLEEKMNQKSNPDMKRAELLEYEPNNTFELADPIELEDIIFGQFYRYDIDIFQLEIEQRDVLYVPSLYDYNVNLGYYLADEDGNVAELVDYYEEEGQQVHGYAVTPGTYYIVALDLNEGGTDGAYAISSILDSTLEEMNDVYRIYGDNRYETALQIAYNGWPAGTNTVVLSRDMNFPDALAGAPLAYDLDAPILLNPKDSLHETVRTAIRDLGATNVVILGGPGAISTSVEKYLRDTMKLNVKRIGGENRFETAAKIANELEPYDSAVVAYGFNFPDALSIAPYAAVNGMPILLSETNNLPAASKAALINVDDTIVVGGTSVISENVTKQLKAYNPMRISGDNRYETSVNIVRKLGIQADYMTIATGENYADALTGSVYAALWKEPIVLVKKNSVPDPVLDLIDDEGTHTFTILGGYSAVSESVEDTLR